MNRCPTCLGSREAGSGQCPNGWHNQPAATAVVKWADSAMFTAEPLVAADGPSVVLLNATPDPLGTIAAAALMYEGKTVASLADVTRAQRHKYLGEMQKTKIAAPLEFVQFHFLFRGVTRAWANQLVRQRMGVTYVQESLRFAVKEDVPVGLPPSLAGSTGEAMVGRKEIIAAHGYLSQWATHDDGSKHESPPWQEWTAFFDRLSELEKRRYRWDLAVLHMGQNYKTLVDGGMPAEDARGLLPLNTLTSVHWNVNLRALLEAAGNRLCTQAQFEWRLVFAQLAVALREYQPLADLRRMARNLGDVDAVLFLDHVAHQHHWQYEAIADVLRPVCYSIGRCAFESEVDRKCSIRDRVTVRAMHGGRDSSQWSKPFLYNDFDPVSGRQDVATASPGIRPEEWLADPGAAR